MGFKLEIPFKRILRLKRVMEMEHGMAVRPNIGLIVASIVGIIAWALFILLYALFWSVSFTIFQNIIVAIVSLIITGLVIGLIWVVWGPPDTWKK